MHDRDVLVLEELEERFELASLSMVEEDDGSCSNSCCLGGHCAPPAPPKK